MSPPQLALQFFFQLAIILVACRLVGAVARRFGQPQVVAEMIAGVLLGPSLLGLYFPELFSRVFPAESMRVLFPIVQFGLAAYMFIVGLEFRTDVMRQHLRGTIIVSLAGVIAPFLFGAALGLFFHRHTSLLPARTSAIEAILFLGATMSITAFPMLARIIQHKKLGGSPVGTISLAGGALNDAAAWIVLAIAIASGDGDYTQALRNLLGGACFVAIAFFVLQPVLARWGRGVELRGRLTETEFVGGLILLTLGAAFTEAVGLHGVFGAFIMGAIMPRGVVTSTLIARIQPLTVALLLPLFFAYSGLNTQIGLLDSLYHWGLVGLLLAIGIVSKGAACWLAARTAGFSNREALGIGTLMNVRGLMGLVIIDIGLQRGVISPALFATLAIMAMITTVMASPVFDWLVGNSATVSEDAAPAKAE